MGSIQDNFLYAAPLMVLHPELQKFDHLYSVAVTDFLLLYRLPRLKFSRLPTTSNRVLNQISSSSNSRSNASLVRRSAKIQAIIYSRPISGFRLIVKRIGVASPKMRETATRPSCKTGIS
jgi:hypothetical protein